MDSRVGVNTKSMDGVIQFETANSSHWKDICDLYKITFAKFEPMCSHLGNMENSKTFSEVAKLLLPLGLSHVAVTMAGELAGFSINEVIQPNEETVYVKVGSKVFLEEPAECRRPIRVVNEYLRQLSEDFLKEYENARKFYIVMTGVHPKFGQRGIHGEFVKLREAQARAAGCQVIFAEATSLYSQRNYCRRKYSMHRWLKFADFRFEGEKVFPDLIDNSHQGAKLFYKVLD